MSLSDASGRPPQPAAAMSYLIDTDLLSFLERRRVPQKLVKFVSEHDQEIFVSVVSWAELRCGAETAPETHRPKLRQWLEETRRQFASSTEPLDEPVLLRWKQLLQELKRSNRTMTCEDSLIAATALHHGHVILTHNTRHFQPAGAPVLDPLA
jgi:predicted nucleic acid-binding protein